MPDDMLATLDLAPSDVPDLPAKARTSLVAHLLRWEHYDEAHRCLQQLLVTHSQLVSVYDSLARVYLAQDQPDRALEMMRRRHALRVSNSSRALEARAHLAAGELAAARAIVDQLASEHPDMLLTWRLQAEFCLATGDLESAEAACQRQEELRPGSAANAQGIACVWQARGDSEKALLWARTALARTSRDERQPSVDLLRLLETLYLATGQHAQAQSTADRLRLRQQRELEELRRALDPNLVHMEPQPSPCTEGRGELLPQHDGGITREGVVSIGGVVVELDLGNKSVVPVQKHWFGKAQGARSGLAVQYGAGG